MFRFEIGVKGERSSVVDIEVEKLFPSPRKLSFLPRVPYHKYGLLMGRKGQRSGALVIEVKHGTRAI
jgi:hypothetical protein